MEIVHYDWQISIVLQNWTPRHWYARQNEIIKCKLMLTWKNYFVNMFYMSFNEGYIAVCSYVSLVNGLKAVVWCISGGFNFLFGSLTRVFAKKRTFTYLHSYKMPAHLFNLQRIEIGNMQTCHKKSILFWKSFTKC